MAAAVYLERIAVSDLELDQLLPSLGEVEAICALMQGEKALAAVNIHLKKHLSKSINQFWSSIRVSEEQTAMSPEAPLASFKTLAASIRSQVECLTNFSSMLLSACRALWKANEAAGIPQDVSSMSYVLSLRVSAEKHQSLVCTSLTSSTPGHTIADLIKTCFLALMDRHLSQGSDGGVDPGQDDEDVEMKDSWEDHSDRREDIADFTSSLITLGLEKESEAEFTSSSKKRLREKASQLAAGVMDQGVLSEAVDFAIGPDGLLHFISTVMSSLCPSDWSEKRRQGWKQDLTNLVHDSVGMARIKELFEIIVDHPDSLPAAEDLAKCYQALPTLRTPLLSQLQSSISTRLLHPGASASSIIHTYISTIRTLSCIDPTGSLLLAITGPICRYLRGRPDAIKCLVSMVTQPQPQLSDEGEGMSLLEDEMSKNPELASPSGHLKGAELDPDPDGSCLKLILAQGEKEKGREGHGDKREDLVGLLVGIFGTPDVFIAEYRTFLATQLLQASDYSCENAIRIVELLKLRFGESSMHACEIMIKDCADSKRTKANVKLSCSGEGDATAFPFSALILSHLYWPNVDKRISEGQEPQESKIDLPLSVKEMIQQYGVQFTALKTPRKLKFRPHQGVVDLHIEAGGISASFKVSPIHATLILQFTQGTEGEGHELSSSELSKKTGLSPALVNRKMAFWTRHGVVVERKESYHLSKSLDPSIDGKVVDITNVESQEDESEGGPDPQSSMLEAMLPFENYVNGMLTNYKQMSLEKLHSMLKMFVMSPKYDRTTDQLASFLAHLISQGKVVLDAATNLYKKPPVPAPNSEN